MFKKRNFAQWPWEMYQWLNWSAQIFTSFGYQRSVWVQNVGCIIFKVYACCIAMRIMLQEPYRKMRPQAYRDFIKWMMLTAHEWHYDIYCRARAEGLGKSADGRSGGNHSNPDCHEDWCSSGSITSSEADGLDSNPRFHVLLAASERACC